MAFHPAIPLLGINPTKISVYIYQNTFLRMFIVNLSIIATSWKMFKCPATLEWINKFWYIWYDGIPYRNGKEYTLLHVTMWVQLTDLILSERSSGVDLSSCVLLQSPTSMDPY